MTRHGGGWTLILTSVTNKWTPLSVLLNNAQTPSLSADYSILKYADDVKKTSYRQKPHFEYMLEAHNPGLYRYFSKFLFQTHCKLLVFKLMFKMFNTAGVFSLLEKIHGAWNSYDSSRALKNYATHGS